MLAVNTEDFTAVNYWDVHKQKSLLLFFPVNLRVETSRTTLNSFKKFLQALGKKIWIFQTYPPNLQAVQRKQSPTLPEASHCCPGASLIWAPNRPPTQPRPPRLSHCTARRPAHLLVANSTGTPHGWASTGEVCKEAPARTVVLAPQPAPLPKPRRAPPLWSSWCAAAAHTRSQALGGSQREWARDWCSRRSRWREFYYYPIITLGSVPKRSTLPPWCYFLLSWLETKSGSMGAIHMMSLQFIATASRSFSLSETHGKINSSQKWLKNA